MRANEFELTRDQWDTAPQAAGCIFYAVNTGRVCVSQRSDQVSMPGLWCTWGGAIDPGETPEVAVRREMKEEAGYRGSATLHPLLVYRAKNFTYHNFLAVVSKEFIPKLNWESWDYAWTSLDAIPTPIHPGLKLLLLDAASLATIKQYTKIN